MQKHKRLEIGKLGEQLAVHFLTEQLANEHWIIRERNWRCRRGELDVVASHDGWLVFVEVRTRRAHGRTGTAVESVDARKQQQVRMTASYYLTQHRQHDVPIRFDVIAITLGNADELLELTHYRHAF